MTTAAVVFDRLFDNRVFRFEFFDGSATGPIDGRPVRLVNERGLHYLLTAPGTLGLARAYLQDDLVFEGIDEGDPYEVLLELEDGISSRGVRPAALPGLLGLLAEHGLRFPHPPPEETPSRARRLTAGLRHRRRRDAAAIHHHYDVSNEFYELVLGPSMAYTCAVYDSPTSSLESAQQAKFDLVCRKLGLTSGMRLLDVGCGWGGMVSHAVRHYGVTALGVTLSAEQARYAARRLAAEGLAGRAQIRRLDYRDVPETGFDAVSSIGLTEHVGPRRYGQYFAFLHSRLVDGGRLLNHCITRPDNGHVTIPERGFINRYVFPDAGLTGSGDIVVAAENSGLEVRHQENLREHYALTCRDWCANLSANWAECVRLGGLVTARVWGLYLAGSRLSFQRNRIQLHQVLLTRTAPGGRSGFGLDVLYPERLTVSG